MSVLDLYTAVLVSGAVLALWLVAGITYRLYLSPLAQFPGPKLAAMTWWYECYYDVLKPGGGLYIWKIEELHKKHGPIIRINPSELHINDPNFYDQIYSGAQTKRDKWDWHVKAPDSRNALGFTVNHDLHRIRREALNPLFSKHTVGELEHMLTRKIYQLRDRIETHCKEKCPINLTVAFLALTMDVITEHAFAQSFGLLEVDDFNVNWKDTILHIMKALPVNCHFGWLPGLVKALPASLARMIAPDFSQLILYKEVIRAQINEVLTYGGNGGKVGCGEEKQSFLEQLRDSEKLPPLEKTIDRLTDELSLLLVAGSETPAKILAIIYYHLMVNPEKLQQLRDELKSIMPDVKTLVPLSQLEKLPYLTAVIYEGLRLHNGITARSQRISPIPLQYKDYIIPAGTPLSSISVFMHYKEDVFPNPRAFKPERWLEAGKPEISPLKRFFVPFGRGTRSCLGYNLGYAVMYLTLAAIGSRFDLEPHETVFSDVDLERDWFIPQARADTKGVRACVVKDHAA